MLRERSSDSVRTFWLDQKEMIRKLREAARSLKDRYPEIEETVLFGSLARGEAMPGSDADLLLVLRDSDLPFPDRSRRYAVELDGAGVDVLAYTREELETMKKDGNVLVTKALGEGIEL